MDLIRIRDAEKLYRLEKTEMTALERNQPHRRLGRTPLSHGAIGEREVDAPERHRLRGYPLRGEHHRCRRRAPSA